MSTESKPRPHSSGRTMAILGRFFWLIVGLVIGAVLQQPISQSISWVSWHVSAGSLGGTPTCNDPGWYREVKPSDAQAYSQYVDSYGKYSAQQTTDNNPETAWVGGKTADPTGLRTIGWIFPKAHKVMLICIRNGFTSDYGTYAGNARIKTATLKACGESTAVSFQDHVNLRTRELDSSWRDYVSIPLNPACSADRVTLTVDTVFKANDGTNYPSLSDVKLYESFRFFDS